jgi:hypothetical protein
MILFMFLILCFLVFIPGFRTGFQQIIFRTWIPAWRYFDSEGTVPVLSVREWSENSQASSWRQVDRVHEIRGSEFFLNPTGNLILLQDTQLRLFLSDPDDLKLVLEGRVRAEIRSLGLDWRQFQYRVSLFDCARESEEDVYCSDALNLGESS